MDAARRRGGIKIVWLTWFMDSVALWQRQDETHYFLDEPTTPSASAAAPASSPTSSSQQVSSEPEPDTDEWDVEPGEPGSPGTLELNEINWDDINDEVEAAMNESDDDETGSKKATIASEDEWTDESNSVIRYVERSPQVYCALLTDSSVRTATPLLKRKRHRSVTPSEAGKAVNGNSAGADDDVLKSPLAKRKKLAAGRTGYSRLKEAVTADDLGQTRDSEMEDVAAKRVSIPTSVAETEEDDGDDEEEDEDDFLARELEEEWG